MFRALVRFERFEKNAAMAMSWHWLPARTLRLGADGEQDEEQALETDNKDLEGTQKDSMQLSTTSISSSQVALTPMSPSILNSSSLPRAASSMLPMCLTRSATTS